VPSPGIKQPATALRSEAVKNPCTIQLLNLVVLAYCASKCNGFLSSESPENELTSVCENFFVKVAKCPTLSGPPMYFSFPALHFRMIPNVGVKHSSGHVPAQKEIAQLSKPNMFGCLCMLGGK